MRINGFFRRNIGEAQRVKEARDRGDPVLGVITRFDAAWAVIIKGEALSSRS